MTKRIGPKAPEGYNWCMYDDQWKCKGVCEGHCDKSKAKRKRCGHGENVEKGKGDQR